MYRFYKYIILVIKNQPLKYIEGFAILCYNHKHETKQYSATDAFYRRLVAGGYKSQP